MPQTISAGTKADQNRAAIGARVCERSQRKLMFVWEKSETLSGGLQLADGENVLHQMERVTHRAARTTRWSLF